MVDINSLYVSRTDFLSKEIKSGNNQIKNIMIHMNQVLKAIKDLRNKLQLPNNNNDDSAFNKHKYHKSSGRH